LSLDQSKQSDSPKGKITPAVLFPLKPNIHFRVNFLKRQKVVSILPHDSKPLLELFCLHPTYLPKGKIAQVVILPHEAKDKYMILHGRVRTASE